jgi:prevent-host-death family protein
MKTVNTTEIEAQLGHYLAVAAGEPVIIEKTHRPFVVLLSYDEYERLKRFENEYWAEKAFQAEAEGYIGESESMKVIQAVDSAET